MNTNHSTDTKINFTDIIGLCIGTCLLAGAVFTLGPSTPALIRAVERVPTVDDVVPIPRPASRACCPDPHSFVRVTPETPFDVPAGKAFVVTAVGSTSAATQSVQVFFDGDLYIFWRADRVNGGTENWISHHVSAYPTGLAANGGVISVVDSVAGTDGGFVLGYLYP